MTHDVSKVLSAPLESLVTITGGGTPSKQFPEYYTGNVPWVTPKDMKSWFIDDAEDHITEKAIASSSTTLIDRDAVLVCIRSGVLAHTLPVAINRVPVTLNQDMKAFRCSERLHPPYLARFLKWYSPRLLQTVRGTTAHNLSMDVVKQIEIPLPPLSEQKRIADILDKADGIRRKRQEAIDGLLSVPGSLFHEMFGSPTTNEKGWEVGTIRDLVSEVKYGTSSKAGNEGRFPILRMNNITYRGTWDLSDLKYIDIAENDEPKYLVHKGDLLFNRTNSKELVGKTAVFDEDMPMAFAGYLVRARTNELAVPQYISGYLNSPHGKAVLSHMCKNIVGMANINAQEFQDIAIAKPPIDIQKEYVESLASIRTTEARLRKALAQSVNLFNSLVQRAFKGDL